MAQATQDKTPLVWIDMEMSGLVPDRDRILEVAMVVTDAELNTLAEAPVYVIHQPAEILEGMDAWNKSTHGKSGLIDKVRASTSASVRFDARTLSTSPDFPCVDLFHESIASRTSSGWCRT